MSAKPLKAWRDKLAHLQAARAIASDASKEFQIDSEIAEAEEWIQKLDQAKPGENELRIDLTHLPAGAPHFLGREAELIALDTAWQPASKTAIVELIAPGGTGKTALVKRWLEGMQHDNYRGAHRIFAWSFYSQGTSDERQASEDHFLAEALKWFGVEVEAALNPWDKGRALAQAVAATRTLLILDGVEPLQYPPGALAGELRAPGLKALLSHLATANHGALCVLTSREWLKDLDQWLHGPTRPQGTVRRIDLGNLSDQDGARLLYTSGVVRAGAAAIGPDDAELIAASREVKGHALTLTLLGSYLALGFDGDIRQRDQVDFKDADQTTGGHAFRVIAAYERWFASQGEQGTAELAALRLLGFFDRPASKANLDALRAAPAIAGLTEALQGLSAAQWNATLKRLGECRLLEADAKTGGLDAHPLVRDYFADRLAQGMPDAWCVGHWRIYAQLKRDTPYWPDTLEGLQPLYQAVAHGCKAGLYEEARAEVFVNRILRGTRHDGFYSTKKLGAIGADLGAVACFFVEPWKLLAPALAEGHQAWLFNETASRLRALGRLAEALEPMRVGAEMREKQQDWVNAAASYSNLSQLQLSLGRVAAAVADAGQAVAYADRSEDAFQRMTSRITLADARHQQGQRDSARTDFVAAEQMQAQLQPNYPLLYSLQGFRYCDLLLAEAERGAWDGREDAGLAGVCGEVVNRAVQTLVWAKQHLGLLDIALDHLTLARCALYADILQGQPSGETARQETEAAVADLRQAGRQDYLPRSLLTRAWLHHHLNDPAAAEADLTEAQQIAERGEMKLHLADIHLTRARLFQNKAELARARVLIEECGYGRRLPELEDAEAAAMTWNAAAVQQTNE
ncbi:MAG: hypothetical protein IPH35_02520 [Rhodoferax sp.]|nr:hypothetical protein [Rhodoferax sp.]